jgi:hypothetical protein
MKLLTTAIPPDANSSAHILKFHKIGELHIEATVVALTDFSKEVLYKTSEEQAV